MARSHLITLTGLSMFVLTLGACSATSNGNGFGGGDGSTGTVFPNGTGAGGKDVIGGDGGDGSIPSTGPGGEVCAGTLSDAKQAPLDMYIMLDQSGSMDGNSWKSVTKALTDFVHQPASAGIGVGIQYFPLAEGGAPICQDTCTSNADCGGCGTCQLTFGFGICSGSMSQNTSCSAADYAKPDVEVAPLPGVAQAIVDSMAAHKPSGGTPTSAALQGAIGYATEHAKGPLGHTTIVVFATDGQPSGCDEDMSNISAIAANGFSSSPSIRTFVIGVGSSLTNLNQIASSGGTDKAFILNTGANVNQAFLDAMNAIRGSALSCSYFIPKPADDKTVDFGKVNVLYTPQGAAPTYIKKVGGAADCASAGNGWYYDDPTNPTAIIVCPATCETFKQDTTGQVEIQSGCVTKIQ